MRHDVASPRLIYVMGPSGAGKDAVLTYARTRIDGRHNVVVAHRYVTRPAEAGHENYVSLSNGEFELRRRKRLFLFDWEAYDLRYAVGVEINLWLAVGVSVVVSGSRAHFASAGSTMPNVLPVMIDLSREERQRRLVARGRESAAAIGERLKRGAAFQIAHPDLVTIDNSGPLQDAGERLTALLIANAV